MSLSRLGRLGLGLAVLFLCALPLASAPVWAGVGALTRHALIVNGVERTYWAYEPSWRAPGEVLPLVFALHGGGGTADGFARNRGFVDAAESMGFVLLAPQGLGEEAAWRHSDDPAALTRKAAREAGDDMAFFAALHAVVLPTLAVEPASIYGVGLSAGGMMTYRLACQRPGGLTLRAIGVVSTTMTVAPAACPYAAGVSVLHIHGTRDTRVPLHIHGTRDTRVPYGGGGGGFFSDVSYPPVERGLEHFRAANACAPKAETTAPASNTRSWVSTCPGGHVLFDQVTGGTHGWFDTPDATARVLSFLATH